MPKENYSEKEVSQIIKRAAELESKQSDQYESLDSGTGLTLDELSQIAIDAGLDPENVRRAAGELSPNPQDSSNTVTVQSNEVICEKWVTGEFTNELADLVIADLNHRYNTTHEKPNWKDNILNDATVDLERQSSIQRTGNSLEWKKLNKHGAEELRVLIQPRNERIRIRVVKQNTRGYELPFRNSVIGYLSYIPYLAGAIILFVLPYNLFINAILGIITFGILQFALKKNSGWLQKKVTGSKNHKLDNFRSEVQHVSSDLAKLIGQPSSSGDQIDIEEQPEIRTESTDTHRSDSSRSRNRTR